MPEQSNTTGGSTSDTIAHDWVDHHASRTPGNVALVDADSGEVWTWERLNDRVGRLATALRQAGVQRGERVAVLAETHPSIFEIQFACFRLGAIFVPLNWRLGVDELVTICADAAPVAMIHDHLWAERTHEILTRSPVDLVFDTTGLDELLAAQEPMPPGSDNTMATPCQLLYTSGTTGLPKGVICTFGTLTWNMANGVQPKGLTAPGVNVYNPLPLFHAGGLNSTANPALMNGARVTTAARFDPAAALAAMTDPANPATHIAAVPVMYQEIAALPEFPDADLSAVRIAVVGGGAASADLVKTFLAKGIKLEAHYGSTELGPATLAISPPDPELMLAGSVGRPVLHQAVRLVDDRGNDVENGAIGEIWVKGPSVTPGYWGLDNAEFFSDGWFKTGDMAWRDEAGNYFLADRAKDMYKSGGENIYPSEVERLVLDSPAVAEVAIIGIPDEKWGEVGLAIVVAAPGAAPTLEDIHEAIGDRVARYKLPHALELVDELPRNVTGKVAKIELRERYLSADR